MGSEMCIRDSLVYHSNKDVLRMLQALFYSLVILFSLLWLSFHNACLLYTSDAADERSSVDLGGRRIIKKKRTIELARSS